MEVSRAIDLIDDKMCWGRGTFSVHHMPEYDEYWQAGEMAIEALKKQEQDRWIRVSERLPKEFGEYRITWKTSRSNKTFIADSEFEPLIEFDNEHGRFNGWLLDDYIKVYPDVEVIAWKPLE